MATAALALQMFLFIGMFGLGQGVWRYLGFFTTWSNIAVAVIAWAITLGSRSWLSGPRARLVGLAAILPVGLVYAVLLRSLWNPQGLHKLAGIGLHDVTPLLFALLWAVMPHGTLRWRDLGRALVAPAFYLALALVRGAGDGWYPYPFLDPSTQGLSSLIAWLVGVMAVFVIIAAAIIAIDQRLGARR